MGRRCPVVCPQLERADQQQAVTNQSVGPESHLFKVGRLALGGAEKMTDRRNGVFGHVDLPPWGQVCSLALRDSRDGENEEAGREDWCRACSPGKAAPSSCLLPGSGRRVSSKFPAGFWMGRELHSRTICFTSLKPELVFCRRPAPRHAPSPRKINAAQNKAELSITASLLCHFSAMCLACAALLFHARGGCGLGCRGCGQGGVWGERAEEAPCSSVQAVHPEGRTFSGR